MDIRKLQRAIVDGLEDVKAQDIVVLDTEHLSPLFERVVLATGSSNRQTKALASSVRSAVREADLPVLSVEGEDNGEWIIVDCGAAVVHVMQPAIREYYRLEEIWGGKPVKLKLRAVKKGLVKASEPMPEDEDEPEGQAAKPAKRAAKKVVAKKVVAKKAAGKKAAAKPVPVEMVLPKPATTRKAAAKKASTRPAAAPVSAPVRPAAKKAAAKKAAVPRTSLAGPAAKRPAAKKAAADRAGAAVSSAPAVKTVVVRPPVAKRAAVAKKAAPRPAAKKAAPRRNPARG